MRRTFLPFAAAAALTLALSACNQPEEAYEPIDDAAQPSEPEPTTEPAPIDPMTPPPPDPTMPPTDPTIPPTDDPTQIPPPSPEVPPTTDPADPPPTS